MALRIFTAVNVWGDSAMSASQMAADVIGVNSETARRWAADYYMVLVVFDPSDIDDEMPDGTPLLELYEYMHTIICNCS